jgi:signal transduction histidine kinase
VGIHYDEQQLTVHVRDDGRGISPETLEAKGRAGHWGLPGMRERASKIGAQLDLRSRPEAGTEMELTIPAATAYRSRRAWGNWFSSRRSSNIDTRFVGKWERFLPVRT